jgi:hypothetical protein
MMQKITLDTTYENLLEPVGFSPVFIMGAHRSGTTLLYRILQATEVFNVLTLYHVVKYDELLYNHINHKEKEAREALCHSYKKRGIINRVVDEIQVDPDLPEEYGFILRNASFKPYVNDASLQKFIELCKKIQFISDSSRPLLLKNPGDFIHFMFLYEKFPNAKFVFIHRDPVQTINSHVKAIRTVFRSKSEYQAMINNSYRRMFANPFRLFIGRLKVSARFGLDLKRAHNTYAEKAEYFLKNIDLLPKSAHCSVKYGDLCSSPQRVITEVTNFLRVSPAKDMNPEACIKRRSIVLLDEVKRKKADIISSMKQYCEYCGFDEQ